MRRIRVMIVIVMTIVIGIFLFGMNFSLNNPKQSKKQQQLVSVDAITVTNKKHWVTVGATDRLEQIIAAELYVNLLQQEGYKVKKAYFLEEKELYEKARKGQLDCYPVYMKQLYHQLGKPEVNEKELCYRSYDDLLRHVVSTTVTEIPHLKLLQRAPMNAGRGMIIQRKTSNQYGIRTISELQRKSQDVRLAVYKGSNSLFSKDRLTKQYGKFQFQKEKAYEDNIRFFILKTDFADVTETSLLDPMIEKYQLLRLVDDKAAYEVQQIAPLVSESLLKQDKHMEQKLNQLSSSMTTVAMTKLIYEVQLEGKNYEKAAKDYFEDIFKK